LHAWLPTALAIQPANNLRRYPENPIDGLLQEVLNPAFFIRLYRLLAGFVVCSAVANVWIGWIEGATVADGGLDLCRFECDVLVRSFALENNSVMSFPQKRIFVLGNSFLIPRNLNVLHQIDTFNLRSFELDECRHYLTNV